MDEARYLHSQNINEKEEISALTTTKMNSADGSNQQLLWSTIVPHTSRPNNRGNIRRCYDARVHPQMGVDGCRTMYEGIRYGARLNPLGPCLGYRAISNTSGMPTPYIYSSYTEVLARIDCFAAGLDTLMLVPLNPDRMKLIGIYLPNCMEWVVTEHAIFALGGATVPMYDTLGPETVQYILTHTGLGSVVCSRRHLEKICDAKRTGSCPAFNTVILVDGVSPDAMQELNSAGLQVISFAKVEAVGSERIATIGHQHSPPSFDDIATFSYTSGTTGPPKGAIITQGNIMSTNAGMRALDGMKMVLTDRHLSYLPLAHIFERIFMSQVFCAGASVAFYRGDPLMLIEDLQACRPTIMPVVPRVLNKVYDKIVNTINGAGGLKLKLFTAAIAAKSKSLQRGVMTHTVYDALIFNKIKKGLGMDHIRLMISGSAPLNDNVMTFFRCMLGVPVVEGYGQTEGSAAATIGHPEDVSTVGHVGGPTGVVEIALYDVPEMGYLQTDQSHRGMPCQGRGEICVRGPNVFKGYYKDPEKTRETIDDEGWMHSGDIGLWRLDGSLQIIDRKKNIFKLSQGEYVAPEKIENILIRSAFIAQCFVYGDSLQNSLVAIVVPDEDFVRSWIETNTPLLSTSSIEEICTNPVLTSAVLSDIKDLSTKNQLQGFEVVRAIRLHPIPFSVDNDLMTPTFKLKRQKIRDMHEQTIKELYNGMHKPMSKL